MPTEYCIIQIQYVKPGRRKHQTISMKCFDYQLTLFNGVSETIESEGGRTFRKEMELAFPPGQSLFELTGETISITEEQKYKLK
jgi:hypothetical protein